MKDKNAEGADVENIDETGFAEQEFYNWCLMNDLDCDTENMSEDETKFFEKAKKRFARAINEKRLIINGAVLEYTISERSEGAGEKLTIQPPKGRAWAMMDNAKEKAGIHKLQLFMCALCGIAPRDIAKITRLCGQDYRLLQDIAALFLAD